MTHFKTLKALFILFSISLVPLIFSYADQALQNKEKMKVVILGDSISEGYGVAKEEAYPSLLQKKWEESGKKNIEITTSAVSGSTTAGGLSRLNWVLKSKPQVLIVALGGNDMLRGFKPNVTKQNISQIIEKAQKEKIKVILVGMKAAPSFGKDYVKNFEAIFPDLAKKYKVHLIKFLLTGVAGQSQYNLPDGIHPNPEGHKKIADHLYSELKDQI